MGALATKAQAVQAAPKNQTDGIARMFEAAWPRIQAVMPQHMSSERLFQLAISAVNTTPKLAQCDQASLCSAVMKCSSLGLEPSAVDGLGRAYILPYKSKTGMHAQMILGYKGMIDLARRSGKVKDISARAVYEGDKFEYEFGLRERLAHTPSGREHAAGEKPTHVYMVCHFTDGGHYMDVMTLADVEAIRKRSKSPNNGPWVTDYEAMAKKTVIRRAFPYLPVSVTAQQAASADETDGGFTDMLTREPLLKQAAESIPGPSDEVSEPEGMPEPEPTRYAVCQNCGTVIENVAPDAVPEDFEGEACCDAPGYIIQEG